MKTKLFALTLLIFSSLAFTGCSEEEVNPTNTGEGLNKGSGQDDEKF